MSFLPVVQRELRVAARAGSTRWTRFLAALAGISVFCVLLATPFRTQPQILSTLLFQVMASGLFAYALSAGLLHTVDSVGLEKREGTLGLLFLTDLRGYDVVLGKLVANSVRSLHGVLAVLPILAVPIVIGGISGGQFWRVVVTLLSTLFFSLSFGLFWSVVAPDFRASLFGTVLGLGLLALLYAVGWAIWQMPGRTGWAVQQFSPLAAFRWARAEPWQEPLMRAWWGRSIGWLWWLGAGALVVASAVVSRIRQRVIVSPDAAQDPAAGRARGLVGYRQHQWADLLRQHPYAWFQCVLRPPPLAFHIVYWSLVGLILLAFGASFTLGTPLDRSLALGVVGLLLFGLHQFLKVQVALAATRSLCEDRHSGALELLIVSGQGRDEIVAGHRQALWRQYALPVAVLLGCQFLPILRMGLPGLPPFDPVILVMASLAFGAASLLFDLDALIRTGLRHALRESGPLEAFRAAYLRVMLPGWVGLLFGVFLVLVLGAGNQLVTFLAIWMLVYAYCLYRVNRRTQVDLEHGFMTLAAGLAFDTDEWMLREDFRRAAMADVRPSQGGARW